MEADTHHQLRPPRPRKIGQTRINSVAIYIAAQGQNELPFYRSEAPLAAQRPDRNVRIPATPAAPASMHDAAFAAFTPPSANTGIFPAVRDAVASISSPSGRASGWLSVGNTGDSSAMSAPAARATATSPTEWHPTDTVPAIRAVPTCSALHLPGKWIPAAHTVLAASAAPAAPALISSCGRTAPASRIAAIIARASSVKSCVPRSFSRNWTNSTPRVAHSAASPTSPSRSAALRRPDSCVPGSSRRSVIA
jgi:hypothetical protein